MLGYNASMKRALQKYSNPYLNEERSDRGFAKTANIGLDEMYHMVMPSLFVQN